MHFSRKKVISIHLRHHVTLEIVAGSWLAPPDKMEAESRKLQSLIEIGRLPISGNHVQMIQHDPEHSIRSLINANSADADLVIVGVREEILKHKRSIEVFSGYDDVGDVLFVNTTEKKEI